MKKLVVIVVLIIAALGGYYAYRSRAAQSAPSLFAEYSGNIELRRVNLSFRVGGKLSEFSVEEGALVESGDTIAVLDAEPLTAEFDALRAAREEARATLERLENGARPQELAEARALAVEYEANLARAEREVARNERLLKTRAVSESAYEASLETRDVSKARLARGRAALELLEEGARREDLDAARAALARADAAQKKAEIALRDATLTAPNTGVLLTRVAEPGAVVSAGQTIGVLSLQDAVWAYVFLEERDLGRICQGARAEIRTDSSSKVYSGRVGYVSPEAEFTPKTVETRDLRTNLVYRARILVDAPDAGLRQGMPVDVRISYVDEAQSREASSRESADELAQ